MTRDVFTALQDFLYTDQYPSSSTHLDPIDMIELANRLCLTRLVALVESHVIRELTSCDDAGKDVVEDVVLFMEPAQVLKISIFFLFDSILVVCTQF